MGYFNNLTNASFKKDKNGNTVFFPWGIFGKGRVLPDKSTEKIVRGFVLRNYMVSLLMIIGVSIVGEWLFLLVLLDLAWFYFRTKSLVSGLPYSEERFTLKESFADLAASSDKFTLWFVFISSVSFVLGGIHIVTTAKSFDDMMLGWSLIIFFGVCSAALGICVKRTD